MKFAQNNHPTRFFGPTRLFGTWEYVKMCLFTMNWMKCNIVDSINVLESIGYSIGAVTLEGEIVFGILYIGIADGHSTFNRSKSETCK